MIEIPVAVVGEVSGKILMTSSEGTMGKGRLILHILHGNEIVAKTISESDGYFSYFGLPPGTYTIRPDVQQLKRLMSSPYMT